MNIFVCIKQVPDIRLNITPNKAGSYIDTQALNWVMNPEDECALEQALLIRDTVQAAQITAIRIGERRETEALIPALAMGADQAILVEAMDQRLSPFITVGALKAAIEHTGRPPDLILCGHTAFGDEGTQIPAMLAQMLEWPCIGRVMACDIVGETLSLARQVEEGRLEKYRVNLPAVVACHYSINTPRYAPLPHIQAAYQKPFTVLALKDLGIAECDPRIRYANFRSPPHKTRKRRYDARDATSIEDTAKALAALIYSEGYAKE